MEILHKRSICITDQDPTEMVGTPVSTRARSVVCNDCGRAGDVASPGYEEEVRTAWATRNGYSLSRGDDGQWVVALP
jgi:hypothetical protein